MTNITTATVNSFKQQLLQAGHCFNISNTQTGSVTINTTLVTALTSTVGLSVGMAAANTNLPSNTFIAYIINSTALALSNAATTAITAGAITFTGDTFKMALIKAGNAGTYNALISTYAQLTGNTDEVTGAGYTAGGFTLTNVSPTVPDSNTAVVTFSANPNWTSATISAQGAMIYNFGTTAAGIARFGNGIGNNTISNHDFGGTQTVTGGTFTVTLPAANGTVGLLRIS